MQEVLCNIELIGGLVGLGRIMSDSLDRFILCHVAKRTTMVSHSWLLGVWLQALLMQLNGMDWIKIIVFISICFHERLSR